jgi:putative transcriptional regulator
MPKKPRKDKNRPVLNLIKEVLQNQEKTQTWLAAEMDVEFTTVHRYANNIRQPGVEVIFEIAKILKMNPSELINDLHVRSRYYAQERKIVASGKGLKKIRVAKGLTEEELAHNSGLSTATIRNFESGQMNPTLAIIYALADALKISAKDLVD